MFNFDLQRFSLGTYDPKKVIVLFGGVEITGFAEDSMIKVKPMSEGSSSIVGAHGDVVRTISPDNRHEVTLSLLQSSASNDVLAVIYQRDKSVGDGVLPLVIKDLSGRMTFVDSQAWIVNNPEVNRTNDAADGGQEWIIHTAGGILFPGGHE